jgi:hypothetical protein
VMPENGLRKVRRVSMAPREGTPDYRRVIRKNY